MAKKKWLESVVENGQIGLDDLQQLFKKDASRLEEQAAAEVRRKKMSRVERALAYAEGREKLRSVDDGYLVRGNIYLRSRSGRKVDGITPCQSCGVKTPYACQFANSSHGPVILCPACKNTAISNSFEGGDAMSLRVNHAYQKRR